MYMATTIPPMTMPTPITRTGSSTEGIPDFAASDLQIVERQVRPACLQRSEFASQGRHG
jgi:hypothetical protein